MFDRTLREPETQKKHGLKLRGKKVLVVDDNSADAFFAKLWLGRLGCEVMFASDGTEALDCFKKNDGFDLILMDLDMPQMDGFEATQQIRQIEMENRSVPTVICALTGNANQASKSMSDESGMNEFLEKPVSPADLRTCLTSNFGELPF